jgi:hypothetical protein
MRPILQPCSGGPFLKRLVSGHRFSDANTLCYQIGFWPLGLAPQPSAAKADPNFRMAAGMPEGMP